MNGRRDVWWFSSEGHCVVVSKVFDMKFVIQGVVYNLGLCHMMLRLLYFGSHKLYPFPAMPLPISWM